MREIFIRIAVGIGLLLISCISERVIKLINSKIKSEDARKCLSEIYAIVDSSVKTVYQESVETLKNAGTFDSKAQKKALNDAKEKIRAELTDKMNKYIEDNFGDFDVWLETAIHSDLYDLKR